MTDAPHPSEDPTGDDAEATPEPTAPRTEAENVIHIDPATGEAADPDGPADADAANAGSADAEGRDAPAGDEPTLDIDALADADPRSKAELLGELVVAESKRDEYLDDLRRSHADFENYRRRILREGSAQRETGKADVAMPLLEVLDDLDRTLAAADGSSDPDLAKGVALVASKFLTTLGNVGVHQVEATEVPFDPKVHEAVQQQPAEEPTEVPMVVQVLRPGYRLGERVLRPAMVVVEQ